MTDRIKNLKTTVMGIIVVVVAITGLALRWFDWAAFGTLMVLGYNFIVAKDTLLEGITLNLWKEKEKDGLPF